MSVCWILEAFNSYKFVYRAISRSQEKSNNFIRIMVGAGRFELPTPCAQDIEALPPFNAGTTCEFNEVACNRLQSRNSPVVDSVAGKFLGVQ